MLSCGQLKGSLTKEKNLVKRFVVSVPFSFLFFRKQTLFWPFWHSSCSDTVWLSLYKDWVDYVYIPGLLASWLQIILKGCLAISQPLLNATVEPESIENFSRPDFIAFSGLKAAFLLKHQINMITTTATVSIPIGIMSVSWPTETALTWEG